MDAVRLFLSIRDCVLTTCCLVVQELGREGVLPFSALFASSKPFNAPFAGLFEQWLVSSGLVLLVPQGDAYLFMLSGAYSIADSKRRWPATYVTPLVSSYPLALINMFVSGGLLFIHAPDNVLPKKLKALRASYDWLPPFRAWTPVVLFFFLSNIFLVCVPLMPPAQVYKVYDNLPYWVSFPRYRVV